MTPTAANTPKKASNALPKDIKHLTEDQDAVAVKGMIRYADRLTNAQRAGQDGPTSYYMAGNTFTDIAADALRRKIAELPGITPICSKICRLRRQMEAWERRKQQRAFRQHPG